MQKFTLNDCLDGLFKLVFPSIVSENGYLNVTHQLDFVPSVIQELSSGLHRYLKELISVLATGF